MGAGAGTARKFSPENLEGLVKFAYFGGFIDMAGVRRLLMVDKPTAAPTAGQVVRGGPGAGLLALPSRSVLRQRRGVQGEDRVVKPTLLSPAPGVYPLPFKARG